MLHAPLEDVEAAALQLTTAERSALIARLIDSLDGAPEDSPEEVAKAWDEEIARRVADFEAGKTIGIPYEQVQAEMRAMLARHGKA